MRPDPFDLNWRHLRAVSAIAARGSMSAAAQAVSLSQPALTQGLAKLERLLGATLFDRRPDGMSVTDAGRMVAQRADAAIQHLRAFRSGGGRGFAQPDMLMTATQLRAFIQLAAAGSFAAASAASGLSQPALHRAVRDLEQVSGQSLAERRGRGVVLTAAGRRLARGARLAAQEITAAIAEISADAAGMNRISVGAMPLCRAILLPNAIARSLRGAPDLTIDVVEGAWQELTELLRDGGIDLAIGALRDPAPPDLEQRPLFVDRLAVVARAGHPLSRIQAPTLDQLSSFPWIVGRGAAPLRAHWQALFAGRTLPPAPVECGSIMTIRGILAGSDLLTLVSPDQVALEIDGGLLAMIGPPLAAHERQIGIIARRGWRPTPAQSGFIALLEDPGIHARFQEIG